MSDLTSRERLQPSLLDRLTDDSPERKQDSYDQQVLTMTQLRRAVLRDLTWLLNTAPLDALQDLSATPLAARSTINYGIGAFAGTGLSRNRITSLESTVAEAIRNYEPRIRPESLRVRLRQAEGVGGDALPSLTFDIQGELWAQPVPQQLFLETAIEMETHAASVVESRSRG